MQRHIRSATASLVRHIKKANPNLGTETATAALSYLDFFGWLKTSLAGWKDINLSDILAAIAAYQKFFGLLETGELDKQTLRLMNTPRCGVPDRPQGGKPRATGKWNKPTLLYYVKDYVQGVEQSKQDATVAQAFASWTNVCGLRIERCPSGQTPDLVLTTGRGRQAGFDGPGSTLAFAYLPQGNDRQLSLVWDLDEPWNRGIDQLAVTSHEVGHLLGLEHSQYRSALMYPYLSPITEPQQVDDIPRIRNLYGMPSPTTPSVPPSPPTGGSQRTLLTLAVEGPITGISVVSIQKG